jgi:phage recombination protein Bet
MTDAEKKVAKFNETVVSYRALGEHEDTEIKVAHVRRFIAAKTRSGLEPTDGDIIKFMQLCKAMRLNPWTGDAYLLGYDSSDPNKPPTFTMIVAVQAMLKRAEINKEFDGIESGILVMADDNKIQQRAGQLKMPGEVVVGAWAKVFRKDRKVPFYATVNFSVYDTNKSRWKKDPAGMIEKVAISAALRKAFPSDVGSLYSADEMDHIVDGRVSPPSSGNIEASPSGDAEFDDTFGSDGVIEGEVETPGDSDGALVDQEPQF